LPKTMRIKSCLYYPSSPQPLLGATLITLPIGRNTLLANDVPESMGPVSENENRSKISVSTESRAEADRVFTGLTVGGAIEMPIGNSPWGTYFGMFRDKFGIEWTVEFDPKGDTATEE
jgi:PhnB protein